MTEKWSTSWTPIEKTADKKPEEEKALNPDQAVQTEKKLPTNDEKKAPVASEKNERVALSPDAAVQTEKKPVEKKEEKMVTCLYCGATYPPERETCPDCGTLKS